MRASVRWVGGCAFGGIALQEVDDRRRLLPDLFVELAVEHDRAVRGHGHGIGRGDDGTPFVGGGECGGEEHKRQRNGAHTRLHKHRNRRIRSTKGWGYGTPQRRTICRSAENCPESQRKAICNYLPSINTLYFSIFSPRCTHSSQPPLSALAPGMPFAARSTDARAAVISLAHAQ